MNTAIRWRAAVVLVAGVTLGSQVLAQTAPQTKLTGLIHDFTAAPDALGPWQLVGEWSLTVNSASGKVDAIASVSMMRSDNETRMAHTHHVRVTDGQVTALSTGYRISGVAILTTNGSLAPFSGSPVEIDVTGAGAVPFANVGVTFGGAAAAHFGTQPIKGVVVY